MPALQLRQHYISGGSSSYSATDNTSFYLYVANPGSEINAFVVIPRGWLHGKKIRYTRTTNGNSGSLHKWIYCEVVDGAYDRTSAAHWPVGLPRAVLGAGRLVLIEAVYGTPNTATITSPVLDLSAGGQDVTLFWRIHGQYFRWWSVTVSAIEILDGATDEVVASLDIDGYTAEDATAGQNYGVMGLLDLGMTTAVAGSLAQPYQLFWDHVRSPVEQGYFLYDHRATILAQPYGLRLGRDLVAPWANAPVRVAGLAQPWRDAGELARGLVQPWQDAAPLAAGLAQEWDILAPLAAGLVQPWAIAADAALVGSLAQGWDLRDVVPLSTDLAQPWTIGTDPALLRYTLTVTVDGHAVQVDSMTLEADLDQDALHATISLGDLADYQRCRDL
ncbi:MAG: hypothetical protein RBT58_12300, partial [Pseudomonadaceae bacterium]|nr:hypothetical protein [Pseudomonadaceae bacterium]